MDAPPGCRGQTGECNESVLSLADYRNNACPTGWAGRALSPMIVACCQGAHLSAEICSEKLVAKKTKACQDGRESRVAKRYEKSRPGFCAGGVRAEPGASLARRALLARSTVPAGATAIAPLPGCGGCAGKRNSGFGGRLPAQLH